MAVGEHEYKTVFEIDGLPRNVPSYSQFYQFQIRPAKYIYKGIYKPWLLVNAPTVADGNKKRIPYQLNMAKALCNTIASLEWAEHATVKADSHPPVVDGEPGEDLLDGFLQDVLTKNHFWETMQVALELAAAEGGVALKLRVDGERTDDGKIIPGTEKIIIDVAQADQFVPTAWDIKSASEGFFISRQAVAGYYYTLIEWHRWDGTEYHVMNSLYKDQMKPEGQGGKSPNTFEEQAAMANTSQDILGFRTPLSEIYPNLEEDNVLELTHGMFVYFKTPSANNVDMDSPLGVSIFANAFDTLHAITILHDALIEEIRLGKKRIIVPAQSVRSVAVDGTTRRYFNADDEVYEALSTDDVDALKIVDMAQELRVDQIVAAINAELNILCLQTGLNQNTFSFSTDGGMKTATEVISEDSKTYTTVRTYQNAVKPALEELVREIISVAEYYQMSYKGVPVSELAKDFDVLVQFDDGVLEDSQTKRTNALTEVQQGLMSKLTYMQQFRGLTESEAQLELKRIADERNVTMRDINDLPTE